VLGQCGARYRFGAPLDVRWLAGGWSSHLEFQHEGLRVRTDFDTRPPRLDETALQRLWRSQEGRDIPRIEPKYLAETKKTNRERDYAIIGELARLMADPDDQILYSRSARDLDALARKYPDRFKAASAVRPALLAIAKGLPELEAALDGERRQLIHANEERLAKFMSAAERWADAWSEVAAEMEGRNLADAHAIMCRRAENLLPFTLAEAP
jgi:hypothetical protein